MRSGRFARFIGAPKARPAYAYRSIEENEPMPSSKPGPGRRETALRERDDAEDRERTGRGGVIPIAMLDVVGEMMGFALNQVIHGGTEPVPVGMGSPMVAPYSAYPTADQQTVVLGTTNDREWQRLAVLIERPDLAAASTYASNSDRVAHRDELDEAIGAWCRRHDLAEIQARADEAGIGNARLNTVADVVDHPQFADRRRWRQIDTPSGPVPALLPPAVALEWSVRNGRVPALGEHTDALRNEVLGNLTKEH